MVEDPVGILQYCFFATPMPFFPFFSASISVHVASRTWLAHPNLLTIHHPMSLVQVSRAILAGILISIGGTAYLHVGGIPGAVLFAFGLLSIVHFRLPLFTGQAGFFLVTSLKEWRDLAIVLLFNVIGCLAVGCFLPEAYDGSDTIFSRIETGYAGCFVLSILCGIIMTVVVQAWRDGNSLLIPWGVPCFIVCGFCHSIADAFYMAAAIKFDISLVVDYLPYWFTIVLGNFVGCNIPRYLSYRI